MKKILPFIFVFAGCATGEGLLTSLEDITTETGREGSSDVNQNRILSIAGLLQQPSVGTLFRYIESRAASTAIGLTPEEKSYILDSTIDWEGDDSELIAIRDALIDARTSASKAIAARVDLTASRATAFAGGNVDPRLDSSLKSKQTDYEKAREDFNGKLAKAQKAIAKPGVIVIRWVTSSDVSTRASAGSLLGVGVSSSKETTGFAILAGIRLSTLYVGSDIGKLDTKQKPSWEWGVDFFPWFLGRTVDDHVRLTTYLFQAKRILYVQDMTLSSRVAANLEASYEQLSNLGETLQEIDEIQIGVVVDQVSSLSNMGLIGNIERKRRSIGTIGDQGVDIGVNDGWQTVYVVDTDMRDLRELYQE